MKSFLAFFVSCVFGSHYETLGVDRSSTAAEIKRAFFKKSREHHPDKNVNNLEHTDEEFKKVNAAYEVLRDPQQRSLYDSRLGSSFPADSFYSPASADVPKGYVWSAQKAQDAFEKAKAPAYASVMKIRTARNMDASAEELEDAFELLTRAKTLYAEALKIQSFDRYRNEWRLMALGDIEQAESVLTASRTISHATTIIRLARLSDSETIHAAELAVSEALEAAVNIIQNKPSVGGIVNITGSNVEYLINDMILKVDRLANALFLIKFEEYGTASSDDEVHRIQMSNLNFYNRYELARLDYAVVHKLSKTIKIDIDSGEFDKAQEKLQIAQNHYDAAKSSISAIKPYINWIGNRPMLHNQDSEGRTLLVILKTELDVKRKSMTARDVHSQLLSRLSDESLTLSDIQHLQAIARASSSTLFEASSIIRNLSSFGNFPYYSSEASKLRKAAADLSTHIDSILRESFRIESSIDQLLSQTKD